jgi:hypothetical protein
MKKEKGRERPMTALEEFLEWCTKERAKLRRQLEGYESGKINMRHRSVGAASTDRTAQEIGRLKKKIADLDAVLKRHQN